MNTAEKKYLLKVGKRIRRLRMAEEMSVLDLARASGVSQQHIRDLELGNKAATVLAIRKLARGMKTTPVWVLAGLK